MGDDDAEMLRRFHAATSGPELVGLRDLASMLLGPADDVVPRPSLRRPPLDEPVLLRLRVELDHSDPPIWRALDVRSDATLEVLHEALMAVFGWAGGHLFRFALGGGPFDASSELFLCPFDVEEGEDAGAPASDVRLDEVLQHEGDVLRYVYDYGDSWDMTLRVLEVFPLVGTPPSVVCVAGERAAPPEDCGGFTDEVDLAGLLDDPAAFDVAETNAALRSPYALVRELGVHPQLLDVLGRLRGSALVDDLTVRLLAPPVAEPTEAEVAAALRPHRWLLDRAYGDGIALTDAGYLKPADVAALAALVPSAQTYPGPKNREVHVRPVLRFRESLQSLGLLRKVKGRLRLTKAGEIARTDPNALRAHLATRLGKPLGNRFADEATVLVLAYAATAPDGVLRLATVARMLGDLGWSRGGERLQRHDLLHVLPVLDVLREITDRPVDPLDRDRVSPVASLLARDVLFG